MGSFIGFFFCAIFGLKDCDPNEFGSFCNYTENISQNKTLAVFILLSIIASAGLSILIVCCGCRYAQAFGVRLQRRALPVVIVGGSQGPVHQGADSTPVVTDSGYKYPTVVIGGAAPSTGVQHATSPPFPLGLTGSQNPSIQELQEQNRLLQEQIRLQQYQLQLQQQLQQQAGQEPSIATPMYTPAPPSYDECMTNETSIRLLEEQNQELQKQCHQQQLVLEKQYPPPGPGLDPTAPPP